jgi:hypothetical protein
MKTCQSASGPNLANTTTERQTEASETGSQAVESEARQEKHGRRRIARPATGERAAEGAVLTGKEGLEGVGQARQEKHGRRAVELQPITVPFRLPKDSLRGGWSGVL